MPMFVMPHISVPIIARYMRFNAFPAAPTNGVIAACTSEATKFLTYYSVGTTRKPASHCNDVEAMPCLVALVELPLLASWLHFAGDTSLFSLIHMMATPTIHEGCTAILSTGKQQSDTPSVQSHTWVTPRRVVSRPIVTAEQLRLLAMGPTRRQQT